MVVDDDEDTTFMLRMMLKKEGYNVAEARSGEECLDKFEAVRPELIILDIMMPGTNGWEVCRRIKERELRISVPISMLSVRKDEEDIKRSLEYAHADAHIGKPVDIKELLATVERLLGPAASS
jgi:DNA-binding response OmpR family regulator